MALPTASVPLKEQWDNTTSIAIPITTKSVAQQVRSMSIAAAAQSATTVQLNLDANQTTYPTWITAGAVIVFDTGALQESKTVASFNNATGVVTLTAGLSNAHVQGTNAQVQAIQGAAGTSTFTFAPQALNTANRGMILELLDLLDRAWREGSATVA